jgi:hypothetical protein
MEAMQAIADALRKAQDESARRRALLETGKIRLVAEAKITKVIADHPLVGRRRSGRRGGQQQSQ